MVDGHCLLTIVTRSRRSLGQYMEPCGLSMTNASFYISIKPTHQCLLQILPNNWSKMLSRNIGSDKFLISPTHKNTQDCWTAFSSLRGQEMEIIDIVGFDTRYGFYLSISNCARNATEPQVSTNCQQFDSWDRREYKYKIYIALCSDKEH